MVDTLNVTVTYLEQASRPPAGQIPMPKARLALLRAENPPVHFYRYLYYTIGHPYNWVSRIEMPDEDLTDLISHPKVHIYVLYINGVPGGFAEIDARHPHIPEIKFFGLIPEFIGKGFGRYFLAQVIDLAWTCSLPTNSNGPSPVTSQSTSTLQTAAAGISQDHHLISMSDNNTSSPANGPKCVRIETCSLDHPAALPLYQKFGFSVIDRREGQVPKLSTYQR